MKVYNYWLGRSKKDLIIKIVNLAQEAKYRVENLTIEEINKLINYINRNDT